MILFAGFAVFSVEVNFICAFFRNMHDLVTLPHPGKKQNRINFPN